MHALRDAYEARERREDARFALICAVLANCHRDPKRRPQPYQVEDFLPRSRPQTREEFDTKLKQFAHGVNARIKKPKSA